MENKRIVAISFHCTGKLFDFDARDLELEDREQVIVGTERGKALGTVIGPVHEKKESSGGTKLKPVIRKANEHDLEMAAKNADREAEALTFCKKRVKERGMEMKLVLAEYLFDGSKIVFYFTADGRVDFRELVRDLAQHFRTRIEMRQIGVRDEAKRVGGIGCCGRELCCCSYLRSFAPVSVKMAKVQGLALNPSKISGQCGRLLCCLGYEYDTYNELRKKLPKCGKKINLPTGPVDVVALNVLAQKIMISDKDGRREIDVADLNKPQKAAQPSEAQKNTRPRARDEEPRQEKTSEGKSHRRPRRRGGRTNQQRSQEQRGQAEKDPRAESRKPTLDKEKNSAQGQKSGEHPPERSKRRNRNRPQRRSAQNGPQNKN